MDGFGGGSSYAGGGAGGGSGYVHANTNAYNTLGASYVLESAFTVSFGQTGYLPNPDETGNGYIRITILEGGIVPSLSPVLIQPDMEEESDKVIEDGSTIIDIDYGEEDSLLGAPSEMTNTEEDESTVINTDNCEVKDSLSEPVSETLNIDIDEDEVDEIDEIEKPQEIIPKEDDTLE